MHVPILPAPLVRQVPGVQEGVVVQVDEGNGGGIGWWMRHWGSWVQ